jgi:hypothetical protein
MKYCLLLSLLILLSCGDSPFLNEESSKIGGGNNSLDMNQEIELEINSGRTDQNTGNQTNQKFEIKGHWEVGPSTSEKNKFVFFIYNLSGTRVDLPHEIKVFLWMPQMGHGSIPVKVKKINTGIFEVSNISFIMNGEWDIHFQFKKAGDLKAEITWPVSL